MITNPVCRFVLGAVLLFLAGPAHAEPAQQRITITCGKVIEQIGLDDYEAWQRQQGPSDASKWRQSLRSIEQVKRLRANPFENLCFSRGLEVQGGRIEEQGSDTLDRLLCQKIGCRHASNIVFMCYFDAATGCLVLTETEAGGSIREEGATRVRGVRFLRKIVTLTPAARGKT